ncbi:MAG: hypothetical protein IRZ11_05485 [Clostridia bacterium]|nr:hypothetical protein [Clostridia bacterium]
MPRRAPGVAALLIGLVILTVGVVVVTVVPHWAEWIQNYPQSVLAQPIPDEAAPMVHALMGMVLGPLVAQVGHYLRSAGVFVGTVLIVVSLFPLGAGIAVLRKGGL